MFITYFGLNCFRLQSNNLSLLIDPYKEKIGLKLPRMQNDIILYSQQQESTISSDKIFIINGAGEYEIKSCFIYGLPVNHQQEDKLIFLIELEGIRLVYLGMLHQVKFTEAQLEKIEGVDILMVPVGGDSSLNSQQATAVVNELEPRLVIPMNYQLPGLKIKLDSLDKFKKELGAKSEIVDKLKISRRELSDEETKLVIINPAK